MLTNKPAAASANVPAIIVLKSLGTVRRVPASPRHNAVLAMTSIARASAQTAIDTAASERIARMIADALASAESV